MITKERVRDLFNYNGGNLYWKDMVNPAVKLDKPAGCKSHDTRVIRIDNKLYLEHRLIFLFFNGYLPEKIDHIDGNRSNNSIKNLRECTSAQNSWNSRTPITNTSGVKGVSWNKASNTWRARFKFNGKKIEVGSFKNIKDAANAISKERKKYHKEFARNK